MSGSADVFQQHRGRLFGIAYRMLGSVAEAEDVVQDAWLRWDRNDTAVENPGAFLATIVTRLSLTALDSARVRRETYIGPWLPEPVSTEDDPTLGAERAEALSLAVLLLLERLSPAERAAYVLHEAFDYPYRRIAEILETSEANARQLATRARAHLARERDASVTRQERERLLSAFIAAADNGDLDVLESVLAEDVVAIADGGGLAQAARRPVLGRDRVASFLAGVRRKNADRFALYPVDVNGEPGFGLIFDGQPAGLGTVEVGPGGITRILIVRNPEKLTRSQS